MCGFQGSSASLAERMRVEVDKGAPEKLTLPGIHMIHNLHAATLYKGYFLFLFLAYILTFSVVQGVSANFAWSIPAIVVPVFELVCACSLGLLLWHFKEKRFAVLCNVLILLVPIAITLVYVAQLFSAWLGGAFLTVLALENAGETQYVTQYSLITVVVVGLIMVTLLGVAIFKADASGFSGKLFGLRMLFFGFCFSCLIAIFALPREGYASYIPANRQVSPVISLAHTLVSRQRSIQTDEALYQQFREGKLDDYFTYDVNNEYPLQKSTLTSSRLIFADRGLVSKPNVIVIFTEGFSARLMKNYGSIYQDLTPNLSRWSDRMLQVDNYFNHTAATYRGLKGQLTSSYPFYGGHMDGGWEEDGEDNTSALGRIGYQTVANILNQEGYESVFFSPHPRGTPFHSFLKSLDFKTIYNNANIEELIGRPLYNFEGLSSRVVDRDLFDGVKGYLQKREKAGATFPFFIATYNIGTHAFLDVVPGGKKYGDGSNQALNRFHNFDAAINSFLEYFFSSSYAANTVLIFTADHAAYPEPPVVAAFKDDGLTAHFVDRIPLLIHSPNHELPAQYDAEYRSSIDFAPTLMHLLGISAYQNSWLGQSIFDPQGRSGFSIAALGHSFFKISQEGVQPIPLADSHAQLISAFYTLEQKNLVYSEN